MQNYFGLKVGVAHDRRHAVHLKEYRLPQYTKQYTLVNPHDYYCVMSVLRRYGGDKSELLVLVDVKFNARRLQCC